ncbi:MAG: DHH family phosphoesterase, partial [Candidatus Niameybacter stercoravium]|nr:DHH family phosphoesterase [Candidatus Niameybacter stercoravium]
MILDEILKYDHIVIQCHDNPDADTIASAYALYTFLDFHQKNVRIIYSGPFIISKPNLKMLVEKLSIPLEYVTKMPEIDFLITVDCHYYNGNLTHFDAKEVCIIDHHISKEENHKLQDIRPHLGSCSTLIWHLLNCYGFNLDSYLKVRTALYYGLLTDTNFLSEARHSLDRDMAQTLNYDVDLIHKLKSSNLSLHDLETAGIAFIHCSLNTADKFAVLEARPCDPNILGFISDLAIQVDSIDTCIVYFKNDEGIKYSLRSCTKEVKANEFAEYISDGIGSGGGHADKAGGFISSHAFYKRYNAINIDTYFHNITRDYFNSFDIIYADEFSLDTHYMKSYSSKALPVGFVISTNIFKENTPICIHTLEGDLDIITSP